VTSFDDGSDVPTRSLDVVDGLPSVDAATVARALHPAGGPMDV
jgi:hypothetical protein